MNAQDKRAWELARRNEIEEFTVRLEALRKSTFYLTGDVRLDAERSLDELRGLINRALARIEAIRFSHDDTWRLARQPAETAFARARETFEELEAKLFRRAAA